MYYNYFKYNSHVLEMHFITYNINIYKNIWYIYDIYI